jgi:hypothetical protein
MSRIVEIDQDRLQRFARGIQEETLREYLEEVAERDTRLAKKVKEKLFGRNVSLHPLRPMGEIAGAVWSHTKDLVPYGQVVEGVRKGVVALSTFLIEREIKQGGRPAQWAMDLFQVEGTQLGAKMQLLMSELDSLILWQISFEELLTDGDKLAKASHRKKLIKAFSKLLLHYRQAEKVIGELDGLLTQKAETMDAIFDLWNFRDPETGTFVESGLTKAETALLTDVLLDVEIHATRCEEHQCLLAKNPLDMAEFLRDVLRIPPLTKKTTDILSMTYLARTNLEALARSSPDLFEGERNRLSSTAYGPRVGGLRPALECLSAQQWREFSAISNFWGRDERGAETRAIDEALEAYLTATAAHFRTFALALDYRTPTVEDRAPETLENSIRVRAEILSDVSAREQALDRVLAATSDYIRRKIGNAKSKRRGFVLMLDVLLQMEMADLKDAVRELNGA